MVSRPEKSTWAVQKTARPTGKIEPRGGDWPAGSLEARKQSKAREKASREEANGQPSGKKSHGSPKDRPAGAKTSAARRRLVSRISGSAETVQGESKSKSRRSKWPAARGKDHWQTKKEPGRRDNQRREEANGQSTGEKYLGSPKDRPAGGKTSTASRIPGSAEAVQSKRKSKSRGRILAAHSGTMAETWSIMFRNISTTTFMNDRMEHGEKAIMSKESILQRRFCECGLESYVIKKRRRIFIHESFDIKFRHGFSHGSSDFGTSQMHDGDLRQGDHFKPSAWTDCRSRDRGSGHDHRTARSGTDRILQKSGSAADLYICKKPGL